MERPEKIGRYEVLEELGRGAMGVVYRAKDPAMDRIVALKTIHSAALEGPRGREFRERFLREARTAGGLTHPGIVSMFDVGEHNGLPYLVMEFVSGPTLTEFVRSRERLGVDRLCELASQIAQALAHAHARGVVHRDIKPANILMTTGEGHGIERPKITDFGVARLAEQHTTVTGQMVGTPAFMPPEQFTGATVDGRSDIFSLGVVLYWLATGEQPFPGESITSISYKVVNTDPISPRRLNPALPAQLDAIILKCLAKSPEERYQNADDLARELSELRRPTGNFPLPAQPALKAKLHDPEATLISGEPPLRPFSVPKAAAGSSAPPAPGNETVVVPQKTLAGVAAAVATVLVFAAWMALRSSQPAVPESDSAAAADGANTSTAAATATAAQPAPVNSPANTPATSPAPAATRADARGTAPTAARPAAATGNSSGSSSAESKTAQPEPRAAAAQPGAAAATPTPSARPMRVDFDPTALARKTNARIEFDASRMPAALEFTLEMNGRIYYEKTGPDAYKKTSDLYLPPGVHEFRVVAREGAVEKVSNTVSTDFKADKRSTLNIELRLQGKPASAGMPNGLYPESQLVLTLK